MKMYCCFTPAYEVLFQQHFAPSLPAGFCLETHRLEIGGAGDFLSEEYLECIHAKMDLVLKSIRENYDEIIVWSDVDIVFFDARPERLLGHLGEHDIAFQSNNRKQTEANFGFFICRCNERVLRFFERVREGLREAPGQHEQQVGNALLGAGAVAVDVVHLPLSYYVRTQGWPPPKGLAMYHANRTPGTAGVSRKIKQFKELELCRRFGPAVSAAILVRDSAKGPIRRAQRRLRDLIVPRRAAE